MKKRYRLLVMVVLLFLWGQGVSASSSEGDSIYYYYNTLSEKQQEQYNNILDGIYNEEEDISVNVADENELEMLMTMIQYDHPELFWLDSSWSYRTLIGVPVSISPHYSYTGEERVYRQNEIDEAVAYALEIIGDAESDYDKIKSIYEYVINTVDYSVESTDNQSIYSSLVNRISVCSGYARATQYLAQQMGLQCIYVSGEIVNRGSHAWNIVRCDGNYYQVDPTFGDPSFEGGEDNRPEELKIGYGYLCITDEEMYTDRIVGEGQNLPVCDSENLNYYRLIGRYYAEDSYAAWDSIQENVAEGYTSWIGEFAYEEDYWAAIDEIQNGRFSNIVLYDSPYEFSSITTYSSYDDNRRIIMLWY